jgi:hypothetical protein
MEEKNSEVEKPYTRFISEWDAIKKVPLKKEWRLQRLGDLLKKVNEGTFGAQVQHSIFGNWYIQSELRSHSREVEGDRKGHEVLR